MRPRWWVARSVVKGPENELTNQVIVGIAHWYTKGTGGSLDLLVE